MLRLNEIDFQKHAKPFVHWEAPEFLSQPLVRQINAEWPGPECAEWFVEKAGYVKKAAWMFPQRLPETAQAVAAYLYSEAALVKFSDMLHIDLIADPWFLEGPLTPRVGGGLHEIGTGGHLGIHVDFDAHPTGLTRAANLLIYLNENWGKEWGGQLELHGGLDVRKIVPSGGRAVLFETNGDSWHGHPEPLLCPQNRARRSLALYYYRKSVTRPERRSTVYRR